MKIISLASSSSGNCYILDNGIDKLLLEGGIPFKQLVGKLNEHHLKLTDFKGCIISHSHNDHSVAVPEISRFMTIYASKETLEAKNVNKNYKILKPATVTKIASYSIISFATEHDCPGSLGFIIQSKNETLLFLTDTKYIRFNLKDFKFTHIMIECNYVDELLEQQELNFALKKRLLNSHMSLTTCIKTLESFNLSRCKEIYLIHLSDARSDEALMKKTVASEFGIVTYVCGKNGGYK